MVDEAEELARHAPLRAVRRRPRQRAAPLGRQRQHGHLPRPARARRQGHGHAPRPGRPPHPRFAGQRQRSPLRLRRRTASTASRSASTTTKLRAIAHGRAAQADHRRGHRLPAHDRLRGVPRDRRRVRRAPHGRRRAHRRSHRRWRAPVAGPVRRRRHHHHAQDAARPRAGAIMCREEYAAAIDKAVFPGLQGGPLMHVVAAKAVAFKEAPTARVQGLRAPDRQERQPRSPTRSRPKASASSPAAPTTT